MEPRGFAFESSDDAINFVREGAKSGRRWARDRGYSLAQDYLKGRLEIILRVWPNEEPVNARNGNFVSHIAPPKKPDLDFCSEAYGANFSWGECYPANVHGHAHDGLVLVHVAEGIQRIKKVVPSRIRLCGLRECAYRWGDAAANSPYLSIYLGCGPAEWEMDARCVGAPCKFGRVAEGAVKGVPEIVNDPACKNPDLGPDLPFKANLQEFAASLVLAVDADRICASFKERCARRFKIIDAFFAAID